MLQIIKSKLKEEILKEGKIQGSDKA